MELTPIQTLFTSFTSIISSVTGFIGTIVTTVIANPVLLIPIGIGLLGTGVALVKKFL